MEQTLDKFILHSKAYYDKHYQRQYKLYYCSTSIKTIVVLIQLTVLIVFDIINNNSLQFTY